VYNRAPAASLAETSACVQAGERGCGAGRSARNGLKASHLIATECRVSSHCERMSLLSGRCVASITSIRRERSYAGSGLALTRAVRALVGRSNRSETSNCAVREVSSGSRVQRLFQHTTDTCLAYISMIHALAHLQHACLLHETRSCRYAACNTAGVLVLNHRSQGAAQGSDSVQHRRPRDCTEQVGTSAKLHKTHEPNFTRQTRIHHVVCAQ